MIKIIRTKMIEDKLTDYEETYYDFKDIAIDDLRIALKSMGKNKDEVSDIENDFNEIAESCMLSHESLIYFEDIETVEDYEEFKEILVEYLQDNY